LERGHERALGGTGGAIAIAATRLAVKHGSKGRGNVLDGLRKFDFLVHEKHTFKLAFKQRPFISPAFNNDYRNHATT
jgi:hypothetical protein